MGFQHGKTLDEIWDQIGLDQIGLHRINWIDLDLIGLDWIPTLRKVKAKMFNGQEAVMRQI